MLPICYPHDLADLDCIVYGVRLHILLSYQLDIYNDSIPSVPDWMPGFLENATFHITVREIIKSGLEDCAETDEMTINVTLLNNGLNDTFSWNILATVYVCDEDAEQTLSDALNAVLTADTAGNKLAGDVLEKLEESEYLVAEMTMIMEAEVVSESIETTSIVSPTEEEKEGETQTAGGLETWMLIVGGAAVALLCVVCLCIIYRVRRKKDSKRQKSTEGYLAEQGTSVSPSSPQTQGPWPGAGESTVEMFNTIQSAVISMNPMENQEAKEGVDSTAKLSIQMSEHAKADMEMKEEEAVSPTVTRTPLGDDAGLVKTLSVDGHVLPTPNGKAETPQQPDDDENYVVLAKYVSVDEDLYSMDDDIMTRDAGMTAGSVATAGGTVSTARGDDDGDGHRGSLLKHLSVNGDVMVTPRKSEKGMHVTPKEEQHPVSTKGDADDGHRRSLPKHLSVNGDVMVTPRKSEKGMHVTPIEEQPPAAPETLYV